MSSPPCLSVIFFLFSPVGTTEFARKKIKVLFSWLFPFLSWPARTRSWVLSFINSTILSRVCVGCALLFGASRYEQIRVPIVVDHIHKLFSSFLKYEVKRNNVVAWKKYRQRLLCRSMRCISILRKATPPCFLFYQQLITPSKECQGVSL